MPWALTRRAGAGRATRGTGVSYHFSPRLLASASNLFAAAICRVRSEKLLIFGVKVMAAAAADTRRPPATSRKLTPPMHLRFPRTPSLASFAKAVAALRRRRTISISVPERFCGFRDRFFEAPGIAVHV